MAAIQVVPEAPVGPKPKVSVLVTTYNHESYLAQALDSALAQRTTFPFEIVVGEDCSTDGTRPLLREYFARHPDVIRMVLPEHNLGPNQMYVEVMRAARGEYFAILDGDDYWISTDKLERQASFLDGTGDCQVCFHEVSVVTEDEGPARAGMPSLRRDSFALDDILQANFVPTASVMHRRVEVDDLPAWFTNFAWIDWLMLVWCAQRGQLRYLLGLESVYRVHRGGLWSAMDRESQVEEEIKVYEHLQRVLPARHGEALTAGMRRCRVQLAVERTGLPHDRPVAVLSDPPLLPWYLNGRAVWQLSTEGEPTTAAVIGELKRLRRVRDHALPTPHWRTGTPVTGDPSPSVYCVVESPREWFDRLPDLQSYLEQFTTLLAEEQCAVYELPSQEVNERRVAAMRLHEPLPRQLLGRHIDVPAVGSTTTLGTLEVVGWALGKDVPVAEVQVADDGVVLARTTVGLARPDLTAAFPLAPGAATAGYRTAVDLAGRSDESELVITARVDGRDVVLAYLKLALVGE